MNKTISILGSTGSIGRQTLDVVEKLGLKAEALTANSDVKRMEEQARKFRPRMAAMADEAAAEDLAVRLADTGIKVAGGAGALSEAAVMGGTVVTAVVGMAGLTPTLAAIRAGKRIALANKETLVCAGELVMETAQKYGAEIIPVDSEHSAIFQCLRVTQDMGEVKRLILTCSGGPFYGKTWEEMAPMTSADALKHPNWRMGPKITVDCATLMNKGLEVIEAMRLYGLPLEKVHVVIHRQSIVHSLVEFRDGAVLAQLGAPDMRLPIQYALTYPRRLEGPADALDLLSCPPLTFAEPDRAAFPCLGLAEEAAKTGGTACAVLNAANEEAVKLYLRDRIGFYDIPRLVSRALETVPVTQHPTLQDILDADVAARRQVF
ncbi:MAG: 1-deoxy-D-xylulose-5-phosphate reductoisomerase [Oscillibacter sp.]|nr:1-deoxy-D-xylulose-5-phosphate reductoisomerase [Oscillibacter sp.]